jgi:hypothetical protein
MGFNGKFFLYSNGWFRGIPIWGNLHYTYNTYITLSLYIYICIYIYIRIICNMYIECYRWFIMIHPSTVMELYIHTEYEPW